MCGDMGGFLSLGDRVETLSPVGVQSSQLPPELPSWSRRLTEKATDLLDRKSVV